MNRRIRWEPVDSNPLWLRGIRTRNPNPKNFTQSMEPERNAVYLDIEHIFQQSKDMGIQVTWLNQGILSFDSEEDRLMFLLRWS